MKKIIFVTIASLLSICLFLALQYKTYAVNWVGGMSMSTQHVNVIMIEPDGQPVIEPVEVNCCVEDNEMTACDMDQHDGKFCQYAH